MLFFFKNFVFLGLLTDREACDLQEINFVPKIPTGSALPNKSPLKEMVKIGIRKLRETGMLAHLWKIWIGQIPKCAQSVDVEAVDLMHFASAFYVLGVGVLASIWFLVGELFFKNSKIPNRCNLRHNNKHKRSGILPVVISTQ